MDKLTAIKIKYDDGTYSDEIPVSVLSENVEWDSTHTLVDVLGSIDVDVTGTIQDQISQLFNEKISNSQMVDYVSNNMNNFITTWLNNNVDPVGSAVIVDKSLTIEGAAADAKITGEFLNQLSSISTNRNIHLNFTDNYYKYYGDGTIRPQSDYCYSNELIVVEGTYYLLSGVSHWSHIVYLDATHNYVNGTLSQQGQTVLLIPPNVCYMIISLLKTEKSSINLIWRSNKITTNTSVIKYASQLSNLDNALWNKIYTFNILTENDFNNITNIPQAKNGILITIDSNDSHYAAHQIYISQDSIFYIRFYIPSSNSFTDWVSSEKEEKQNPIFDGVLYNAILNATVSSDFAGSYSIVDKGYQVGSNLRLKKYYSINNRTGIFIGQLYDGTYSFGTRTSNAINTRFIINVTQKTVQLYGFSQEEVPFLTNNHYYSIELTKTYQNLYVKITDMNSGDIYEKNYIKNGSGGAGEGAVETENNVPMQYDYYFCDTVSGTQMVIQKIIVKTDPVDIILYGDSISEPEAYWPTANFSKSWTQLLIKKSSKKVVSSGRSGTKITELYERIQNELPYIGAKYCVITIGTNDGNTVANLTQLIQYIKSLNIIPILNHIPCFDNNGDTTSFITRNEIIDTVRNNENVKGIDFDLATSINYDGQLVNTNMMWLETYSDNITYYHHPNIKGCAAMFAQLKKDCPELL